MFGKKREKVYCHLPVAKLCRQLSNSVLFINYWLLTIEFHRNRCFSVFSWFKISLGLDFTNVKWHIDLRDAKHTYASLHSHKQTLDFMSWWKHLKLRARDKSFIFQSVMKPTNKLGVGMHVENVCSVDERPLERADEQKVANASCAARDTTLWSPCNMHNAQVHTSVNANAATHTFKQTYRCILQDPTHTHTAAPASSHFIS